MIGSQTIRFGDLYEVPSRNGIAAPARVRGTGTALVNMRELFAWERIAEPEMELAPLPDSQTRDWLLAEGDLLFARQSLVAEGAGKCVYVQKADRDRTFESHIIRVRLKQDIADSRFYFYFFLSRLGRVLIETIVEQVAAAGIRASDLAELQVPFPDRGTQAAIANTLASLDDLADHYGSQIKVCDEFLRATLHRGQQVAVEEMPIGEAFDSIRLAPSERDPTTAYVGMDHMDREAILVSRHGSLAESKSANRSFAAGDVLFGRIRPYFRNVGIATFGGVAAQSIEVLRATAEAHALAAYLELSSQRIIDVAVAHSTGTTMPQVKWDAMTSVPLRIPAGSELDEFNRTARPLLVLARHLAERRERIWSARVELANRVFQSETHTPRELVS